MHQQKNPVYLPDKRWVQTCKTYLLTTQSQMDQLSSRAIAKSKLSNWDFQCICFLLHVTENIYIESLSYSLNTSIYTRSSCYFINGEAILLRKKLIATHVMLCILIPGHTVYLSILGSIATASAHSYSLARLNIYSHPKNLWLEDHIDLSHIMILAKHFFISFTLQKKTYRRN